MDRREAFTKRASEIGKKAHALLDEDIPSVPAARNVEARLEKKAEPAPPPEEFAEAGFLRKKQKSFRGQGWIDWSTILEPEVKEGWKNLASTMGLEISVLTNTTLKAILAANQQPQALNALLRQIQDR